MKTLFVFLFLFTAACAGPRGDSGERGADGLNGLPGLNGSDGQGCTVTEVSNGALVTCASGSTLILNGVNGQNAPPTAYTVTELIDVCGKQSAYDEVLLRLANGQIIGHFSSGNNQFLVALTPGNYVTTDGTHCYFKLNQDGSITNEHN